MKRNLRTLGLVILAMVLTGTPVAAWATTPWTPIAWQDGGKLRNWVGDRNQNFVDDQMEGQTGQRMVLVDLNRCAGDPARSGIIQYLQTVGDVIYVGKYLTFVVVTGVTSNECLLIAQRPEVAMVETIPEMRLHDQDRQAMKVEQSAFYPLNLSNSGKWKWPSNLNGKGVNIAIVDSGVCDDSNQPSDAPSELKGKYQYGYDVSSQATAGKFVNPKGTPGKNKSHGTLMARLAMGTDSGIAPGVGLVDFKFCSDDPQLEDKKNQSGANEVGFLRFLDALETIVEKHKDWNIGVVNLSSGAWSGQKSPYDGNDCVSQLVNRVVAEGIVVVASAGNNPPMKPPATASWAITVGAANSAKLTPERQYYTVPSSFVSGPRPDNLDQDPLDEMKPEIVAPAYMTSSAAARISGLGALLLQKAPDLNPGSLKDLLIRTAEARGKPSGNSTHQVKYPKDTPTWNGQWGFGFVDAYGAVTNLLDSKDATDLTFKGFDGTSHPSVDPPWYFSPALKITEQSGKTLNHVMKAGTDYTIHARLWNNGPNTAKNVRVNFGFYWFTAGANVKGKWQIPRFHHIGAKLAPEIKTGEQVVSMNWRPPDHPLFEHGCVFVSIDYGLDSKFSNQSNFAQRNLQVKHTSSPAVFRFRLENALPTPATIKLRVTTKNRDWAIQLSRDMFFMDKYACAPIVQAEVMPPADAQPGDESLFFITPLASPLGEGQSVELGGVALRTIVGEQQAKPDQPAPRQPDEAHPQQPARPGDRVPPEPDQSAPRQPDEAHPQQPARPGDRVPPESDQPAPRQPDEAHPQQPARPGDRVPPEPGQSGVHGRVFALDNSGRIRGVVATAKIEFQDPEGQIVAQATSDELGYYTARLRPGTYSYKVQAADFRNEEVGRGLQVKLPDRYTVYNFSLTDDRRLPTKPDARPPSPADVDPPPIARQFTLRVEVIPPAEVVVLQHGKTVAGPKSGGEHSAKLPSGTYVVYAEARGFHALATDVTIQQSDVACRLELTPIEPPPDEPRPEEKQQQPLVIQVVRPAAVEGEADAPRHEPINGARVEIRLGETLVASGISGQVSGEQLNTLRQMKIDPETAGVFVSDPLPIFDGYYVVASQEGFHSTEKITPIQERRVHVVVLTPLAEHKPPDERPPDERPPDERPPDERPPDERPPDERPPDEQPPRKQPQVVRVQVVDRETGRPLDGAAVVVGLDELTQLRGEPEGGGLYRFQLDRGDYWIHVGREGYREYESRFDLREQMKPRYLVKLIRLTEPPPKDAPPASARLVVQVLDVSRRERPGIGGASVLVRWSGREIARGATRGDGVAEFRVKHGNFEREQYEVIITKDQFVPSPAQTAVEVRRGYGECVVELRPDDKSPPSKPPGRREATLRVRVVDARQRERAGIGGARVLVNWGGRQVAEGHSNERGVVDLRLAPRNFQEESYEVVVVAEGYHPSPARHEAQVRRGHGECVVELRREDDRPPDEPRDEAATLVVQVQGLDLNAPVGALHALGGAQVVVRGNRRQWEGRTADNGQWRVNLPAGRYHIEVNYPTAQKPATGEVMVGKGGEVRSPPLVIKYRTPD